MENRYKSAVGPVSGVAWDGYLYASGLCLYHIDETYSGTSTSYFTSNKVNVNSTTGSSRNRPYGVGLEETDQTAASYNSSSTDLWYGTNAGDVYDIFASTTQASFDSIGTSYPISYLNDGVTKSGICITSISAAAASMTANFSISPGTTTSPTLAVSPTTVSFSSSAGTSSAVLVTNSTTTTVINYTVSDNADWITTSATSGSTPGSFTITVTANTSTSSRSGTVTVTSTTSGVLGSPKTVTVTQAGTTSTQNDAGSGTDAGDTFTAALTVSPGSWTGCYLDAVDRNDYYKFSVTAGQVIKVKITPPSTADFDLYLYDPSQVQKASSTRGTGYVDSVVYTAASTGYWYARAYEYSGSGNYSLLISVTGTTGTWTTVTSTTQSAHPYVNNFDYTWTITGPTSATKIKVYFDSIKVETGYDTVYVMTGTGTVVQKWSGTYRAIWSNEITGNVAKIRLKTDYSVTGFGFLSTKYQYYTVTASSPADIAEDVIQPQNTELLSQNHPNPVKGKTQISYNIPDERHVSIKIYNISGQLVKTLVSDVQKAGIHNIGWDAKDDRGLAVANGTYIYRLDAGNLSATKKMIILK